MGGDGGKVCGVVGVEKPEPILFAGSLLRPTDLHGRQGLSCSFIRALYFFSSIIFFKLIFLIVGCTGDSL